MGNLAQIVSAAQENGRRIDMERYSDVAADILNDLHTERLAYNSEYVPLMDAINRLAEYEDTGLEPKDVVDLMGAHPMAISKLVEYHALGPIARLRELAQADKEGRCVVLPCESVPARYDVADMLKDALDEYEFTDTSVGIFGITWAESDLLRAIIDGLNQGLGEPEKTPRGDQNDRD